MTERGINDARATLAEAMASLISDELEIRSIGELGGVDLTAIALVGSPTSMWDELLRSARRQGDLSGLLELVERRFESVGELIRVLRDQLSEHGLTELVESQKRLRESVDNLFEPWHLPPEQFAALRTSLRNLRQLVKDEAWSEAGSQLTSRLPPIVEVAMDSVQVYKEYLAAVDNDVESDLLAAPRGVIPTRTLAVRAKGDLRRQLERVIAAIPIDDHG